MVEENLGRCYELSFKFLMNNPEYILVHGIITNLSPPFQSIYHAWCENNDIVYDSIMEKEFPKIVYKALFKAVAMHKYTYEKAREKAFITEHYGSWDTMPSIDLSKFYDSNGELKPKYREKTKDLEEKK